jgi:chromosome condensin MukBEF ATPase and DNA-binding subunit MukB
MLAHGCRTERFEDTYESAWRIIGSLAENDRAQVLLPSEIVDAHLRLNETQAGITLDGELEKLIRDRKTAARRLREQAQKHDNRLLVQELNERRAEIELKILQTANELRRMNFLGHCQD